MKTAWVTQGCSVIAEQPLHSSRLFLFLTLPASEWVGGVCETLGGDRDRTADPKCPKGSPIPSSITELLQIP